MFCVHVFIWSRLNVSLHRESTTEHRREYVCNFIQWHLYVSSITCAHAKNKFSFALPCIALPWLYRAENALILGFVTSRYRVCSFSSCSNSRWKKKIVPSTNYHNWGSMFVESFILAVQIHLIFKTIQIIKLKWWYSSVIVNSRIHGWSDAPKSHSITRTRSRT